MTPPNLPRNSGAREEHFDKHADLSRPIFRSHVTTIIIGIALLIILIHVGFFKTYIAHFPKFNDATIEGYHPMHFDGVQHFHGIVMMSWVFMLLLQPILIRNRRMTWHRRVGRLSYILAPLVLLSIFLVNRHAYHGILQTAGAPAARAFLSLTFPALVFFAILYFLAIRYRHVPRLHMRFMASTAFLLIPPALDRMLIIYFQLPGYDVGSVIELSIIGAVTIYDSLKTKRLSPFVLVLVLETLHKTLWHLRETPFWQSIGGAIAQLF